MDFCRPLDPPLSKKAVKYEFNFNLFLSAVVNQILLPSSNNICVPFSEFIGSKAKSVVLMPIVLINKGQAPIKPFNLILN